MPDNDPNRSCRLEVSRKRKEDAHINGYTARRHNAFGRQSLGYKNSLMQETIADTVFGMLATATIGSIVLSKMTVSAIHLILQMLC